MNIERWTSGADYDQWMGRWSRLLADKFLTWLALTSNLRYLDVCCGSGVLTEAIFERAKPARVEGIDASLDQIRFARAHRASPRVNFEIGNALNLPFAADTFDVAVCGLGLNFVSEPERAVREMCRVTVPKGIIAGYVWDYAEGARFLREFWHVAAAVDGEALTHDQARRFPLCNPDALQALFERAGMNEVEVVALDIHTRFTSFDDYWQPFQMGQGSAPNYLASRTQFTRQVIRERLRKSLPTDTEGAIELSARAWAVRRRR